MKRSNYLLVSALVMLVYISLISSGFMSTKKSIDSIIAETPSTDVVNTTVGNLFSAFNNLLQLVMAFNLIVLGLGLIFNIIAYIWNSRASAMTSLIFYCTVAVLSLNIVIIPIVILTYIGWKDLRDKVYSSKKNLMYAPKCVYCGTPRMRGEVFNRYGFCEDCKDEVSSSVRQRLANLQNACSALNPALLPPEKYTTALSDIDQQLNIIRQLEQLRPRVPMFKSSTLEYETTLLSHRAAICEKLGVENIPPLLPERIVQ